MWAIPTLKLPNSVDPIATAETNRERLTDSPAEPEQNSVYLYYQLWKKVRITANAFLATQTNDWAGLWLSVFAGWLGLVMASSPLSPGTQLSISKTGKQNRKPFRPDYE